MLKKICLVFLGFASAAASITVSAQITVDPVFNIFPRKAVVEEWTGTWCGMCTRGIAGMDYMNNNYGNENFIGLAVHCDDIMETPSYSDFIKKFTAYYSFPGSTLNRKYILDPSKQVLEQYYHSVTRDGSYALVTAEAFMPDDEVEEAMEVTAAVRFSLPLDDVDLRVAFVLTEDEVGPYGQMNTYSGGILGEMDGWEKLPSRVFTKFNDVVRDSTHPFGVPESLPSSLEEGTDYYFSATLPLNRLLHRENAAVVALLIDSNTGEIINADKVKPLPASMASVSLKETGTPQATVCRIPGGVRISGDIKEGRVFTTDGQCETVFTTERDLSLPPGLHIITIVTSDGATLTRKLHIGKQ